MKKYKLLFILFVFGLSLQTQAQWHKLPKQFYWDYIPFMPSAPQRFLVPAFVLPVGDGHVFIASYYYNGSVSAYYSYFTVHQSFDDFSSWQNVNELYYTYPRDIYFQPKASAVIAPLYHKKDSCYSWIEHIDNNMSNTTVIYKSKYTKNAFQTTDSISFCMPNNPLSPATSNCVTDNYMYVAIQVVNGSDDSLFITRAGLTNGSKHCTKTKKYRALRNGSFKPINDSTVFFYCVSGQNISKQLILKTIDYGQTWNPSFVDSVNTILNYTFTSDTIGYILLGNSTLLKTTNGGNSWAPITTPSSTLTCFSFFNDSLGYIGGIQGFLSKTTDGGQTWNNDVSGTTYSLKELFAVTRNVAYFRDSISDLYKNTPLLVSVKNHTKTEGISVFPNPASNTITVQTLSGELGLVTLYNILGEVVLQTIVKDHRTELDIRSLAQGVYQLMIKGSCIKIVKE